ncbi:unannotated protein [freshwater metagenome]|uniref:Unannotated protein n=1 Tax=freshwater metagenome TaxID=449393 RepID=A0A6J7KCX5_9ZZZZ
MAATTPIVTTPSTIAVTGASSLTKNEAMTTKKPANGPVERSMPPVIITVVWPIATNPSALAKSRIELMLKFPR